MSINIFPPVSGITLDVDKTSGSQKYSSVTDSGVTQLMTETLKELKIMNLHLSIISDIDIKRQDVEI